MRKIEFNIEDYGKVYERIEKQIWDEGVFGGCGDGLGSGGDGADYDTSWNRYCC